MTVRELIQKLLSEAPDLDADIYINSELDEFEMHGHKILNISSGGSNDSVTIEVTK